MGPVFDKEKFLLHPYSFVFQVMLNDFERGLEAILLDNEDDQDLEH